MGAAESTEGGIAGVDGLQVGPVLPHSPAHRAGLIPFFDYIVKVDGYELPTTSNSVPYLAQHLMKNEGRAITLTVYNSVKAAPREVSLTPDDAWGGSGLLGCGLEWTDKAISWHVTGVKATSPLAGKLRQDVDYIIGLEDVDQEANARPVLSLFCDADDFHNRLASKMEMRVNGTTTDMLLLLVFNARANAVREEYVNLGRSETLGIDVASGFVHRIMPNPEGDLPTIARFVEFRRGSGGGLQATNISGAPAVGARSNSEVHPVPPAQPVHLHAPHAASHPPADPAPAEVPAPPPPAVPSEVDARAPPPPTSAAAPAQSQPVEDALAPPQTAPRSVPIEQERTTLRHMASNSPNPVDLGALRSQSSERREGAILAEALGAPLPAGDDGTERRLHEAKLAEQQRLLDAERRAYEEQLAEEQRLIEEERRRVEAEDAAAARAREAEELAARRRAEEERLAEERRAFEAMKARDEAEAAARRAEFEAEKQAEEERRAARLRAEEEEMAVLRREAEARLEEERERYRREREEREAAEEAERRERMEAYRRQEEERVEAERRRIAEEREQREAAAAAEEAAKDAEARRVQEELDAYLRAQEAAAPPQAAGDAPVGGEGQRFGAEWEAYQREHQQGAADAAAATGATEDPAGHAPQEVPAPAENADGDAANKELEETRQWVVYYQQQMDQAVAEGNTDAAEQWCGYVEQAQAHLAHLEQQTGQGTAAEGDAVGGAWGGHEQQDWQSEGVQAAQQDTTTAPERETAAAAGEVEVANKELEETRQWVVYYQQQMDQAVAEGNTEAAEQWRGYVEQAQAHLAHLEQQVEVGAETAAEQEAESQLSADPAARAQCDADQHESTAGGAGDATAAAETAEDTAQADAWAEYYGTQQGVGAAVADTAAPAAVDAGAAGANVDEWAEFYKMQEQDRQVAGGEAGGTHVEAAVEADTTAPAAAAAPAAADEWAEFYKMQAAGAGTAAADAEVEQTAPAAGASGTPAAGDEWAEFYKMQAEAAQAATPVADGASAEADMAQAWAEYTTGPGQASDAPPSASGGRSSRATESHSPTAGADATAQDMQQMWDAYRTSQGDAGSSPATGSRQSPVSGADAEMARQWEEYAKGQTTAAYVPGKISNVHSYAPIAGVPPQPMKHSPMVPPKGTARMAMFKPASLASLPSGASTPTDAGPRSFMTYLPHQPVIAAALTLSPKPGSAPVKLPTS